MREEMLRAAREMAMFAEQIAIKRSDMKKWLSDVGGDDPEVNALIKRFIDLQGANSAISKMHFLVFGGEIDGLILDGYSPTIEEMIASLECAIDELERGRPCPKLHQLVVAARRMKKREDEGTDW